MEAAKVVLTEDLVARLKECTYGNCFWKRHLEGLSAFTPSAFSVHLAVLLEPYLGYILEGSKTVESRFSKNRTAPFKLVDRGDVVLLKRSAAKGISGLCVVSNVWFYELNADSWNEIRGEFTTALRAEDPSFWNQRKSAHFATLMRISHAQALPPIEIPKRDRRGWVVLRSEKQPFRIFSEAEPRETCSGHLWAYRSLSHKSPSLIYAKTVMTISDFNTMHWCVIQLKISLFPRKRESTEGGLGRRLTSETGS